jgi:hypothetical protein
VNRPSFSASNPEANTFHFLASAKAKATKRALPDFSNLLFRTGAAGCTQLACHLRSQRLCRNVAKLLSFATGRPRPPQSRLVFPALFVELISRASPVM